MKEYKIIREGGTSQIQNRINQEVQANGFEVDSIITQGNHAIIAVMVKEVEQDDRVPVTAPGIQTES